MKRDATGTGVEKTRRQTLSDKSLPHLLTLPSLLIVFGVLIIPIVYSLFLSVHNLVLSSRTYEFVGLQHYSEMLKDPSFINSIWQTLKFTVLSVAAEMVFGIAVALVLNQEFKGRGFVRGLMILLLWRGDRRRSRSDGTGPGVAPGRFPGCPAATVGERAVRPRCPARGFGGAGVGCIPPQHTQ